MQNYLNAKQSKPNNNVIAYFKAYVYNDSGGQYMPVTNATKLRKNLYGTLEEVINYNEHVIVTSKMGNAVIISEADYNALLETVYLISNPEFMEGYKDAKAQDRSTYKKLDLTKDW